MTRRAIYPGSFDPITNGHLDLIARASKLFDEVIIALLINPGKSPMFDLQERVEMITEVVAATHPRVKVDTFDGLLIDYAVSKGAQAVVRGIRAISDYEYELQMALMNRRLCPQVETVFLMSAEENSYISSRLVKEVFTLGGVIEGLVPDLVIDRMKKKVSK